MSAGPQVIVGQLLEQPRAAGHELWTPTYTGLGERTHLAHAGSAEQLRRLMPGIVAASLLSAMLAWNEFLFALTLTRSAAKTAPVGISEFTNMYGTQWGSLTAAATVTVAPILVDPRYPGGPYRVYREFYPGPHHGR